MKKICFLLGSLQGGGVGRVASLLSNVLIKEFEVHIISYCKSKENELYFFNESVKRHYLFEKLYSIRKAVLLKNAIWKLAHILKQNKIDVLICCDAIYFVLGVFAAKKAKCKCVCWEHTSPLIVEHKFHNMSRRIGMKHSTKYIVLTKAAENHYINKYPKFKHKIVQIYNPISLEFKKSQTYNKESKKIISVGRLSYPKNFERLISIISIVFSEYSDWELHIYGDGPLKNKIQSLIYNKKMDKQVFLMGQVKDICTVYQHYAFQIMTSRYEGFPMTLLEAAINGMPLISFDISTGPNEIIINNENGFLIQESSDDDMINAIKTLIKSSTLRKSMSEKSHSLIKKFVLEEVAKQWIQLLSKI